MHKVGGLIESTALEGSNKYFHHVALKSNHKVDLLLESIPKISGHGHSSTSTRSVWNADGIYTYWYQIF